MVGCTQIKGVFLAVDPLSSLAYFPVSHTLSIASNYIASCRKHKVVAERKSSAFSNVNVYFLSVLTYMLYTGGNGSAQCLHNHILVQYTVTPLLPLQWDQFMRLGSEMSTLEMEHRMSQTQANQVLEQVPLLGIL